MKLRHKFLISVICAVAPAWIPVHGQGNPFDALDYVSSSARDTSPAGTGALDYISSSASVTKENTGASRKSAAAALEVITASTPSALDIVAGSSQSALDIISGSGRKPDIAGALSYIGRAFSSGSYYNTGAWEYPGSGSDGLSLSSGWTGGMYFAPQWGRITSNFGYRPKFGRMHKGIDIAMNVGDTICVPLPGVVARINYEAGGYGHYIVVVHPDGLETRYAHLSATLVMPGQHLAAGQPIALSGNTGNSTGPHLHFETRVGGTAIDPTTVFDFSGGMMMSRAGAGMAQGMRPRSKAPLAGKSTYVVRAGDTVSKIAAKAGISVYRLCQLNFMMENQTLTPGTMLKLR